jgi:hypothetical protein
MYVVSLGQEFGQFLSLVICGYVDLFPEDESEVLSRKHVHAVRANYPLDWMHAPGSPYNDFVMLRI